MSKEAEDRLARTAMALTTYSKARAAALRQQLVAGATCVINSCSWLLARIGRAADRTLRVYLGMEGHIVEICSKPFILIYSIRVIICLAGGVYFLARLIGRLVGSKYPGFELPVHVLLVAIGWYVLFFGSRRSSQEDSSEAFDNSLKEVRRIQAWLKYGLRILLFGLSLIYWIGFESVLDNTYMGLSKLQKLYGEGPERRLQEDLPTPSTATVPSAPIPLGKKSTSDDVERTAPIQAKSPVASPTRAAGRNLESFKNEIMDLFNSGRCSEAREVCRQAIMKFPNNVDLVVLKKRIDNSKNQGYCQAEDL